jgi:hypothetical protein
MPIGRRRRARAWPPLYPLASLQITGVTTSPVTTLVGSIPDGASGARIQCEGGNVRWRADGGDPTPTVGMIMIDQLVGGAGAPIDLLDVEDAVEVLRNLKFIAISVTAKVDCQFFQRA